MSIYIFADDTCIRMDLTGNAAQLNFNFKKTEFVVAFPNKHDS